MAKMLNATIAKILDIGQFLDIGDVHHTYAHQERIMRERRNRVGA